MPFKEAFLQRLALFVAFRFEVLMLPSRLSSRLL